MQTTFTKAFERRFSAAIDEALHMIREQDDYAGGFYRLAKELQHQERTSSQFVEQEDTQRQLRVAVKMIWDECMGESLDVAKQKKRKGEFKPSQDDLKKASDATAGGSAAEVRTLNEKHLRQVFYIEALYVRLLPVAYVMIKNKARQLFPPKGKLSAVLSIDLLEPERIPVTSDLLRTEIADFLALAEKSAQDFAELELRRHKGREKIRTRR